MIDTKYDNRVGSKKEVLDAEFRVYKALGDFINENMRKCIDEHNVAEAYVWIGELHEVTAKLARVNTEYKDLVNELKLTKEEP